MPNVQFRDVEVIELPIVPGAYHPTNSSSFRVDSADITVDWKAQSRTTVNVDTYERSKKKNKRGLTNLILPRAVRKRMLRKQGFETSDTEDEGDANRRQRSKKKKKKKKKARPKKKPKDYDTNDLDPNRHHRRIPGERMLRQTLSDRFTSSSTSTSDEFSKQRRQQSINKTNKPRRSSPQAPASPSSFNDSTSSFMSIASPHDYLSEDDDDLTNPAFTSSPSTKNRSWTKRTKTALGTLAKQPVRLARSTRKRFSSSGGSTRTFSADSQAAEDGNHSVGSDGPEDDRSTSTTERMNTSSSEQLTLRAVPPPFLSNEGGRPADSDLMTSSLRVLSLDEDENRRGLHRPLEPEEYVTRLNDAEDDSDHDLIGTSSRSAGSFFLRDGQPKSSRRQSGRSSLTHVLGSLAKQPVRLAKSTPKALGTLAKQPVRLAKSTPNAIGTLAKHPVRLAKSTHRRLARRISKQKATDAAAYSSSESFSPPTSNEYTTFLKREEMRYDEVIVYKTSSCTLQDGVANHDCPPEHRFRPKERDGQFSQVAIPPKESEDESSLSEAASIGELGGFKCRSRSSVADTTGANESFPQTSLGSQVASVEQQRQQDENDRLGNGSNNMYSSTLTAQSLFPLQPLPTARDDNFLGTSTRSDSCCIGFSTVRREGPATNRRSSLSSEHLPMRRIKRNQQLFTRQNQNTFSLQGRGDEDNNEPLDTCTSPRRFPSSIDMMIRNIVTRSPFSNRSSCSSDDISISSLEDSEGSDDREGSGLFTRFSNPLTEHHTDCMTSAPTIPTRHVSASDFKISREELDEMKEWNQQGRIRVAMELLMAPVPLHTDQDNGVEASTTHSDKYADGDAASAEPSLPEGTNGLIGPPRLPNRHDSVDRFEDDSVLSLQDDAFMSTRLQPPPNEDTDTACFEMPPPRAPHKRSSFDTHNSYTLPMQGDGAPPRLPCRKDSIDSEDFDSDDIASTMSDSPTRSPVFVQPATSPQTPQDGYQHSCLDDKDKMEGINVNLNMSSRRISWTGEVVAQLSSSLSVIE